MRVPVSWLRSLVQLPDATTTKGIADVLTRAGLNVERIEQIGADVSGPVVVGRVLESSAEPQKNGKTIFWCRVDVGAEHNGDEGSRGIVCGAPNVAASQLVVVALPGAELPGGFGIAARKTYGHVSDGMICAEDELGLGDGHDGIMVLPEQIEGRTLQPGLDAMPLLASRDEVLEIDITPDLGYALSVRGVAREVAQAFGVSFADPYRLPVPAEQTLGYPVRIDDEQGCSLFVALTINNIDSTAPSPLWLQRRLQMAGMRSISLTVDITNYVMLESGQPLHAYDAATLSGPIVVRRALPGEQLTTLDDQVRKLGTDDLLITDDSGPIGIAGVMGGASTEVSDTTERIVLEAAHFDPVDVGRTFRSHKLPSEASKRFERTVDPALPYASARAAAALLAELGGGELEHSETVVGSVPGMHRQQMLADLPQRILGAELSRERVIDILTASGVNVIALGNSLTLTPPSWRPDLADPYDYVEEVGRKLGFDAIASVLPKAPAGRGLTREQRGRRAAVSAAAALGFVELISLPFISSDEVEGLGITVPDPRADTVRLANPLDDTKPLLRSSLLPGLFAAVARNTSRSQKDLALFESGRVFIGRDTSAAPRPGVSARPSIEELTALDTALPDQPRWLAGVLTGEWNHQGWDGQAAPASWQHAVALAESVAASLGVTLTRRKGEVSPWHPGRCAELLVGDAVIGCAGELHPTVIKTFGLPPRTAAVELDLDELIALAPEGGEIRPLSPWPMANQDVALVVADDVAAADVRAALVEGAGGLLESIHLFDVYTGRQVERGKKSLAFALRFRAPDRTLTDEDAAAARDAAIAVALARHGATQRA